MNTEVLSLAKYLASSRAGFALSEMNLYLSKKYEEKELYEILKPYFYDLDLFCDARYKCSKIAKLPLPSDEAVITELEKLFKKPALPKSIEELIEAYIADACGGDWYKGKKAELIRENIVKQKEEYWKGEAKYPEIRVISYLLYHFPVYFSQFQFILLELLKNGLLMNKMSFLDAGAGPGTISLSILDFLGKLLDVYSGKNINVNLSIKINSIEQARENIDCYKSLTSSYLSDFFKKKNANITIGEPFHASIENATISEQFDFIIFSNVLTEMKATPVERADVVERVVSSSKNPTIIIVEPADLDNSTALRVTQQNLVKKGFTVYSPCTFIWGKFCAGENCWSFQELGDIEVPGFMKKIARKEPYRYVNTDMKFSSVIMRKDDLVKHGYKAKGKFLQLANLKRHVEKKVNVAASVMSGNLGDEKTLVFKVCDGSTSTPCYAVLPAYHINEGNKALLEAGYSDIVEIYGTLVRENKAMASYNLLITRNTIVKYVG